MKKLLERLIALLVHEHLLGTIFVPTQIRTRTIDIMLNTSDIKQRDVCAIIKSGGKNNLS